MIYALVTTTKLVSVADLYTMAKALEINVKHLSLAYLLEFPTAVVVIDKEEALPKGCYPVVMVDEGGESGTLAEHWFDPKRGIPAMRVLVQNTTALNSGPHSVSEAASHEILESTMNPKVRLWQPHPVPKRAGVEVAYECCDQTQDHYVVRVAGTDWQVSNFVTPHWYRSDLVGRPQDVKLLEQYEGFGLDWCKRLKTPGEIGPEGYAVMRERQAAGGWRKWSEDATGPLSSYASKLNRTQHPASRTRRMLSSSA